MSKIRFEHRDLTLLPNPPTGATLLAYDSDGMLKQKDSAGVISKIGGGDLLIEREITKAELLTAYSSPIVIIPDPTFENMTKWLKHRAWVRLERICCYD